MSGSLNQVPECLKTLPPGMPQVELPHSPPNILMWSDSLSILNNKSWAVWSRGEGREVLTGTVILLFLSGLLHSTLGRSPFFSLFQIFSHDKMTSKVSQCYLTLLVFYLCLFVLGHMQARSR